MIVKGIYLRWEGSNPQNNIVSFDTIYHAALQVFIVESANGGEQVTRTLSHPEKVLLVGEVDVVRQCGVVTQVHPPLVSTSVRPSPP